MHCPNCNTNNEQRNEMKDIFCGCCADKRNISFHRFVQYQIGFVCWLTNGHDASVPEMNNRCMNIIHNCYKQVNKKINRTFEECKDYNASPHEVMIFLHNNLKVKIVNNHEVNS